VSEGIPETTIFYNPATGYYGFSTRFPGRHPHHSIVSFDSVDAVLRWCDPHREHIWEEPSDADESKLLISRDFRNRRLAHGAFDARRAARTLGACKKSPAMTGCRRHNVNLCFNVWGVCCLVY
jgi:hypothetical protein